VYHFNLFIEIGKTRREYSFLTFLSGSELIITF